MRPHNRISPAWGAALLAGALAAAGCASQEPGRTENASATHQETFEAAKSLASQRNVPLLVDFYSPT